MSLVLPVLFHWSPTRHRKSITRLGLRPSTARASAFRPSDDDEAVGAVCLGTSPSHAWSLSGAIFGEVGDEWDCWQVALDDGDAVYPLPFYGNRLKEVRVANRIPKSRVWLVGSRTMASRWGAA